MIDLEFAPAPLLAPFVKLIWVFESDDRATFRVPHRVLPDGIVEVVFHYRTPMVTRFAGGPRETQPGAFAISQASRFIEIESVGPVGLVSVRFFPWGARQFFDVPVGAFADRQVAAAELWGASAVELEERIALARSARERADLLDRFLLDRLARHRKDDLVPLVRYVWERRGRIVVRDMSSDLGVGERRLERSFAGAVGVGPKRFARLVRFLSACRRMRDRTAELTSIAHDSGYYDQAHFIRDFREFSGFAPGDFRTRANISYLDVG